MRRAAVSAGALAVSGSATAVFARTVNADTIPDNDLAYIRLLVGAELLAADFEAEALASGKLSPRARTVLRKMAADEKAHYAGLARLLVSARQVPATAEDIDFSYPKRTYASQASIMSLAVKINALVLGAYLGAIENVQTPGLRLPIGQIAANEAQHAGALAALGGNFMIGRAFAPALEIGAASTALDGFES